MIRELEIRLYGRVQGVNFRYYIRKGALTRGLKGIVMNRDDGSVFVVAQGKNVDLESFLSWLQQSPGFSEVTSMHYHWRSPSKSFRDFSIIRTRPFLIDKFKSLFNLGKTIINKGEKVVPKHVVIIPDGNRRWARKKGLKAEFGHYTSASFQHLLTLFRIAKRLGVKYLTIWGFSTENWKRSEKEISALFDLLLKSVKSLKKEAHIHEIRFRHIGRKDRLPKKLVSALEDLEKETSRYENFNVQLCLDYGGRDELIRAVNKMIKMKVKKIDEKSFVNYLDANIPDVDLIIRTSGEQRLSGFMPFQSVYAELYFSQLHFPDFDEREFMKALEEYSQRQRRFGS